MLFLEYPKCSTCQKAKKWLDGHQITYTDRHIVEDNPTYGELKEWYEKSGLLDRVKQALDDEKISYVELGGVVANPELSLVRKGIALCLAEGVDFVLAVGGGSVMDSAKDIANGAANPEIDVWDFSLC